MTTITVQSANELIVNVTPQPNVEVTIDRSGGGGGSGTVTSVALSGGTTGLTATGSPVTTAGTITLGGTLAVANGGTGATTANAAINNLLPSQAGNSGKVLGTDGLAISWVTGGGGSVTAVTGTLPILSSGGTAPAISLAAGYGDTQNPYAAKTANYFLASPDGSSGLPVFRAITATDIPILNQNTTGTAANITAASNSTLTTLSLLSLPYAQLSGAVPTWNQNTTGTAANVTDASNSTLTTLSALSLPYSQLSGTVPTWNQNTTGTAANVTGIVAISNGGTGASTLAAASIPTFSSTSTLTNKRIDPRVDSVASAGTLTPDVSAKDIYAFTALAANLTINAPTGTPVNGNKLIIRLLDNGTPRTLTWNATYTAIGVALPTTTTANKTTYVGCVYNSDNTRWDVIAVTTQG